MSEHMGHEYSIERVENKRDGGSYPHEIYLYVDGDDQPVVSASQLESQGVEWDETESWAEHLHRYARAYIHGLEDADE